MSSEITAFSQHSDRAGTHGNIIFFCPFHLSNEARYLSCLVRAFMKCCRTCGTPDLVGHILLRLDLTVWNCSQGSQCAVRTGQLVKDWKCMLVIQAKVPSPSRLSQHIESAFPSSTCHVYGHYKRSTMFRLVCSQNWSQNLLCQFLGRLCYCPHATDS